METIEELMKSGDELMERVQLAGEPDWQAEAANIPDDAYPEEDGGPSIRNRMEEPEPNIEMSAITAALNADLQPLGKALAGALQAGDEAAMRAALKKISKNMPDFLQSAALEDALGKEFLTALTGDTPES